MQGYAKQAFVFFSTELHSSFISRGKSTEPHSQPVKIM